MLGISAGNEKKFISRLYLHFRFVGISVFRSHVSWYLY